MRSIFLICFSHRYVSKSGKKRLVLTTKRAHKGFYKGNGATKEGRLTSKGKFIVQKWKQVELVVPDLTGFKVSSSSSTSRCGGKGFTARWVMDD